MLPGIGGRILAARISPQQSPLSILLGPRGIMGFIPIGMAGIIGIWPPLPGIIMGPPAAMQFYAG